jgi:hypothetical protein
MAQGGCLCGAIRFATDGAPNYAGFERANVRFIKGTLARFSSSPGVHRGFCSTCGSTLTYEGERWPTEIHLHVGVFDDPTPYAPKGHAFADERLAWLHLADPPLPKA